VNPRVDILYVRFLIRDSSQGHAPGGPRGDPRSGPAVSRKL